jgi:putative protease
VLIDRFDGGESAGYPVLCKGRFNVNGKTDYAIEEPTSLSVLDILPDIIKMGVSAIKIEGRQRSPAYVAQVTSVMRAALDSAMKNPDGYVAQSQWVEQLARVAEGTTHTLGALERQWQ